LGFGYEFNYYPSAISNPFDGASRDYYNIGLYI
jgi:hypothetical protein